MRDRSVLEEAERRLRELASFLSEHNPRQANALVSLAADLSNSVPNSANEQVALVLLGMDPYANPRPEYVALPHGPMSCSESEKLGNKLANAAGELIDAQRANRSVRNLLPLPVAERFDDLRHALAEWRGSPPQVPVCHACGMGDSCPDHDPEVEKETTVSAEDRLANLRLALFRLTAGPDAADAHVSALTDEQLIRDVADLVELSDDSEQRAAALGVFGKNRVFRVAEGPKSVWSEDPPADLRVLLSDSSGDLWDARGGTLRFSREEWAVVVEALSALRRSIVDRWDPSEGWDPSEEVTRDMAAALLGRISAGAGRSFS